MKNTNFRIKLSISWIIGFFLLTKVLGQTNAPELENIIQTPVSNDLPITEIKHTFWIKVKEEQSNLNYALSLKEVLSGTVNAGQPNIQITGSLVLKSRTSVSKCFVKLPSEYLEAINTANEKITIKLEGKIGSQKLNTDFVQPRFDEYNEVSFSIEGFILPESLNQELQPSKFAYKEDLRLIVEFKD